VASLKELLKSRLKEKIPKELLDYLPSRYPIIGGAVLLHLRQNLVPFSKIIAEELLNLLTNARSVWVKKGKAEGVYRAPHYVCVAGDCNPIVIHRELNTYFKLDISKLTFSPGNSGERERLIKIVSKSDTVLDMFACCGNLSMPIAVNVKPKRIYALELNPLAYSFLLDNIRLNKVSNIICALMIDNHFWDIEEIADHVLLGFLPRPDKYQISIGIRAITPEGGMLHYHVATKRENKHYEVEYLRDLIRKNGYKVIKIHTQKVKGVAPNKIHIVIRAEIKKVL